MEKPLMTFPSVKLWFKKTIHSRKKPAQAVARLSRFFEAVETTPDVVMEEWRRVRYDYKQREMFLDKWTEQIEAYYYGLDEEYAPLSRKAMTSPVVSFFKHSKMPIEPDLQDRVYVKYHNRDVKREEIQRILDHARLRARTFFLVMLESGQRPYTLVQLRYKHVKEDFEAEKVPMKIDLPAELIKDRVGHRWTFVGEDGFAALKEYLKPRLPLNDDDLVFAPIRASRMKGGFLDPEGFGNAFSRIVLKLGLDKRVEGGKPKPLRLYCLRKYFRNNIRVSDSGYREFWMGHTFGTDEHYLTRDVEKHRQEYAKAYDNIRILQSSLPESLEDLKNYYEQRLQEQRNEILTELDKQIHDRLALMEKYISTEKLPEYQKALTDQAKKHLEKRQRDKQ